MNYLLLYSSKYGQTKKIIFQISKYLCNEGNICDIMSININKKINISYYKKVLIGASVLYGHLNPIVLKFTQNYYKELNAVASGFFCVNLAARKINKNTPKKNIYACKFLSKTKWKPNISDVFAGALYYSKYNFFDRTVIRFIMQLTGGETNVKKN
ncbi:menaquinone-dependent protoporphyrinogen IX dehydrogenase [Arsenophonus endosymbiont of Lipoptena cervi]|uniref:menaquinone-dependent protoporphyrinogen IX dehydrogenase n=1 Tax=Arsenophonus endosymbiont of Lipoptena cervi TaxID=363258 RepID=UPI00376F406F